MSQTSVGAQEEEEVWESGLKDKMRSTETQKRLRTVKNTYKDSSVVRRWGIAPRVVKGFAHLALGLGESKHKLVSAKKSSHSTLYFLYFPQVAFALNAFHLESLE